MNRMLCSFLMALALHLGALAAASDPWWPAATDAALQAGGENRSELETALTGVPQDQRESMVFLIENMPAVDLKTMKSDFLIAHVAQAHEDIANEPWGKSVPKEIFLNDVLPYASLNESRDGGRAKLRPIA